MRSKPSLFTFIAAAALALAALLPAYAGAEYLVPEGNSAVNQYTEGIPSGNGEFSDPANPEKTIGAENAQRLDAEGEDGRAAAEVAAETAPEPVRSDGASKPKSKHGDAHKGKRGSKEGRGDDEAGTQPAAGGAKSPPSGGSGAEGSSGAGSVLAAATGTEAGHLGILLPLVLIAALVCGVVFAARQRKRPEPS